MLLTFGIQYITIQTIAFENLIWIKQHTIFKNFTLDYNNILEVYYLYFIFYHGRGI